VLESMDGMLSLFETVTYSSRHDALLQTFLKTCSEHQAFLNKVISRFPYVLWRGA
jgi:hypothetical protein